MKNNKTNEGRERGKAYLKYAKRNWVTILFIISSMIKGAMLDTAFLLIAFGFTLFICVSQEEYYKKKDMEYKIDSTWNGLASKFIVSVVLYVAVLFVSLIYMIIDKELAEWREHPFLFDVVIKTYGKTIRSLILQVIMDFLKETKVGRYAIQKGIMLKNMIFGYIKGTRMWKWIIQKVIILKSMIFGFTEEIKKTWKWLIQKGIILRSIILDFLKETKVGKWIHRKGIIFKNLILGYIKGSQVWKWISREKMV